MNGRAIMLTAAVLAGSLPAGAAADAALKLHLPRQVTVAGEALRLGDIAVVRGQEGLAEKASGLAMGRAPWSREEILIDRPTILSRLASAGIPAGQVRITGAEKVSVRRSERAVPPEEMVALAHDFLGKGSAGCPQGLWRPVKAPAPLMVPDMADIQLQPRLTGSSADQARVEIVASQGTVQLAVGEVLFRRVWAWQEVVAARDIPAGAPISPENAEIRRITVDHKPQATWTAPYGQLAARAIPAGTVLGPGMLKSAQSEVLVRKNQPVVMRLEAPGFTVTAVGEALQDGRGGEMIKVRNVDTRRVVTARVADDGTVEPIMDEVSR